MSQKLTRYELFVAYEEGKRDFAGVDLREVDLERFTLTGVVLRRAKLGGASLVGADLREADLSHASLHDADLSLADLGGARLDQAALIGATLTSVRGRDASLQRADLSRADLSFAELQRADLSGAELAGANLHEADLEGANLRRVRGARFDTTCTRAARRSPRASDPWSVLRRSYTGPKMVFNLLFLIAFILPYVGRTAYWVGVNHSQVAWSATASQLDATASDLRVAGDPNARTVASLADRLSDASPCLAAECTERSVIEVLLGFDKGLATGLLVLALVLYNVCRAVLTFIVAPLREEEERSGYTPSAAGYGWLVPMHRAVIVLQWVAVASLVYHAGLWLSLTVQVPA